MKSKLILLKIIFSAVIYNITITVFSWCFKLITDSLTLKNFELFYQYIWLAILVVMIQAISNYIYIKRKNTYIKNVMIRMKSNLLQAIFYFDVNRFQKKNISEYQSFLFNDLVTYEQKAVISFFDIFEKSLLVLFSCIAIVIINPKFLIMVILLIAFSIGLPVLFGRYAKKYNEIFSESCKEAMEKVAEMLNGFIVLRAFSSERVGIIECDEVISGMESSKAEFKSVMALFQSMLIFMTTISTLVIFTWGGNAVFVESISIGELIALIQLLFNIAGPLMGIMTAISNLKATKPILEQYKKIINVEKVDRKELFSLKNAIRFEGVSYSYLGGDKFILTDINYRFEKNKKYAIVGENGSGKSTLLKLIAGLVDLSNYQGKILIDDIERKNLQERSFWENVAYISQNVFLFKKGLKKNIFLVKEDGPDTNFKDIIEKLGLCSLIKNEEELKDNEYKELSGGEKQRVVFAREILKNSEMILADEPDSALDPEAGKVVQEILLGLEKTCIVVTHRVNSSLAGYDEILVLENGKIVEFGSYHKLMEMKGLLYRMSKNTI